MNFDNLEELKKKLISIKKKGFIKSHRKNNTGIGKTLEDEMDIAENNLPEGDFKIKDVYVELKAQRKKASSRVTLSTKEPNWIINKYKVINKTAYRDKKGRVALKIILKTTEFNRKGFKIELVNDKIYIIHKVIGKVGYFNLNELIELIKHKIGDNLLLVLADVKKGNEIEYFHYVEASLFSDFNEETFKKLIKEGIVVFEFRLHLNPSGSARDRGSGFRINRKFLSIMYKDELTMLS